jgi:hypothetical protein
LKVVEKGVERLTLLGVIFEIGDCDLVLDHCKRVSSVDDAEMELA